MFWRNVLPPSASCTVKMEVAHSSKMLVFCLPPACLLVFAELISSSRFWWVLTMVYNAQKLIGFWTLSIVQYSKILKIREHNISETGSVSVLRSGGRGWFLVCSCFFDPEDRGNMFLRNVGWNSMDYMASCPRSWYCSCWYLLISTKVHSITSHHIKVITMRMSNLTMNISLKQLDILTLYSSTEMMSN
jgi:hypothetical protein